MPMPSCAPGPARCSFTRRWSTKGPHSSSASRRNWPSACAVTGCPIRPMPWDAMPAGDRSRALQIIALACLAHVLSVAHHATFPALIPLFQTEWGLSNSESGWISGIFFAGYLLGVPVLVPATDSLDPRRIYVASALVGGLATLAFAWLAQGFWSALLLRALAGLGMAGTFMVGLRLVTDR